MNARPVKIVATLGPASAAPETVDRIVAAGADVVRLNLAHGTPAQHAALAGLVRAAAARAGRQVAVLLDLPGPKVRLLDLPGGALALRAGEETGLGPAGSPAALRVDLPEVAALLERGDRVMIADGLVEVEVQAVAGGVARCRVLTGGTVLPRKGVTLPSRRWTPAVPTAADREALRSAVVREADLVAISYAGAPGDVEAIRSLARQAGADLPVVAKIETRRALDHLQGIVAAADAVMVARGDLGVELPPEEVPPAQRRILAAARCLGRPAIVATQMLGSMTASPRPTRAETADVAGAVWGGADAVMLSDETAAGAHPVAAVETMSRIIAAAAREPSWPPPTPPVGDDADAVAIAACRLAADIGAAAIVAATESGSTAAAVSRHRPACPVVGLTPNAQTARRLCLLWGVTPLLEAAYHDLDDMGAKAAGAARALGFARPGDPLVCTAGFPFARRGGTDLVRVIRA